MDARLTLLNQNRAVQVYPKTILVGLEGVILPANHLTDFEYDFEKSSLHVIGEAPGYKEVAQQLMAFKSSPLFSDVVISSLSRMKEEDGALPVMTFEITAVWNKKN